MFFLNDKNKDNKTIEAIVRFKGQRYKIVTGEKIASAYWNFEKSQCKEGRQYKEGTDINIRLNIWKKHIQTVVDKYALKFIVPTQEEFKKAVKEEVYGITGNNLNNDFLEFAKSHKIAILTSKNILKCTLLENQLQR